MWEYTAILDASLFNDGPVEVRAIAWPRDAGEPRVLGGAIDAGAEAQKGNHSVFLNANAGSSLWEKDYYVSWTSGSDTTGDGSPSHPFKSIGIALKQGRVDHPSGIADGVRIFLMSGDHPTYTQLDGNGGWLGHTNTDHRFVTITAAPGVSQGDVTITSGVGLRTKLVHVKGVTVRVSLGQSLPASGDKAILWADNCHFIGAGRNDTTNFLTATGYQAGVYVSDSLLESMNKGCLSTTFVRNNEIRDIAGDALLNVKVALNNTINDTGPLPGDLIHADFIQFFAINPGLENIIIFNLHATDATDTQGWHVGYTSHIVGSPWRDFAFVNLVLDMTPNFSAQWIPTANHVLWWNLTIPEGRTMILDNPLGENTTITNFDMRHCVFNAFTILNSGTSPSLNDQSWASNNHYMDTTTHAVSTPGDDVTTGGSKATLFVNASQGNYEAKPGSVLLNRLSVSDIVAPPVDALGREITQFPAAIGALQP